MKIAKATLASTILLGIVTSAAQAETCYKTPPFSDLIRLTKVSVLDEATGGTHTLVVGNWTAGSSYSIPVVGSEDTSINPSGIRIGIHGTQHTIFFGNHSDCTLDDIRNGASRGSTCLDVRG